MTAEWELDMDIVLCIVREWMHEGWLSFMAGTLQVGRKKGMCEKTFLR